MGDLAVNTQHKGNRGTSDGLLISLLSGLIHPGVALALIAVAVSAVTVFWVYVGRQPNEMPNLDKIDNWQGFILVMWVLGPPIYFFFEYLIKDIRRMSETEMKRLEAYQERARNIWLALAAVLAFVFGLANFPS